MSRFRPADCLCCALLLPLVEAVVVPVCLPCLRRARESLHRSATREAVGLACEPVVRGLLPPSSKLSLGLGPATVDHESALDLLEDRIIDEAGHPVLNDVLAEGILAHVSAVLEELVQRLGYEPKAPCRSHPLRVETIADLLYGHAIGVVVKDLSDDGRGLGGRLLASTEKPKILCPLLRARSAL